MIGAGARLAGISAIVGIGASAGGIEALTRLFAALPTDAGLAVVVVIHLSPAHESRLAELLQSSTAMPVQQVSERTPLERDNVYVIPPGHDLSSVDSHLHVTPMEPTGGPRTPVDHFFRTLAAANDGRSVGIVLSGTGSDGALGLRTIKEHGGLTIVQDPSEAAYDGMPLTALATAEVDLVLSVDDMPAAVVAFARTRPRLSQAEHERATVQDAGHLLEDVVERVRKRTGRDFSRYKPAPLLRRVGRRMQLHGLDDLESYRTLVMRDPGEAAALADDFLINVTEFFRDPEVYAEVERTVVPRLFEGRGPGERVRAWSVGCSTGEEAYSLAILLLEAAGRLADPPAAQLFASDLHAPSLQRAREGRYPATIEGSVSPERLARFFDRDQDTFVVKPSVRESVVFALHNVLTDAPFSQLDMVTCRNLLIYLDRPVQRELLEVFHYGLKPDGYLLLGPSDSLADGDGFVPLLAGVGLFRPRRRPRRRPPLPTFRLSPPIPPIQRLTPLPPEPRGFAQLHREVVERHGPASLLLDGDDSVVHLSDRAGRFLRLPGGSLSGDVYRLIREELRLDLRAALHEASTSGGSASSPRARVRIGDDDRLVTMTVEPVRDPGHEGYRLVVFHELQVEPPPAAAEEGSADAQAIARLEAELDHERRRLRVVLDQQANDQEGLRASNEELTAVDEELRVTMEEIETAREELQSVNEELISVDQENRHRVEELTGLGNDLNMLMTSTDIAMLFLDREFRIVRFTPRVVESFNVRHSDRGRPLSDLTHRFGSQTLLADAQQVLRHLGTVTRELRRDDGSWFLTRVLPYRSSEERIEGVVVTLVDITAQKRTERDLQVAKEQLEQLTEDLRSTNEELAAFNQSVSHDLHAPLREIRHAAAKVLERTAAGQDQDLAELIARVAARADEMAEMIDGLMALSSAGRRALELELVDLGGIAKGVLRDLARRDAQREVEVRVEDDLVVRGDRRLLRSLMVNLLENAWKFTARTQGAAIAVGRGRGGDAETFFVRDNGVGFDMAQAGRLFSPFTRLHAREDYPGTGLGLSLVRRIVRRHGGKVDAVGAPDAGVTVSFTLPGPASDGEDGS